jgi:hypothetical protein
MIAITTSSSIKVKALRCPHPRAAALVLLLSLFTFFKIALLSLNSKAKRGAIFSVGQCGLFAGQAPFGTKGNGRQASRLPQ